MANKKKVTKSHGKRDVHLLVNEDLWTEAKVMCLRSKVHLNEATEVLWDMWIKGEVDITNRKRA